MPEKLSFLWPGRIPAFYDIGSKTCYFNTSLTRASKVDDLFVEEVLGHHGFREVLGPERAQAFFRNLYEAFKDDPDMPGVIRKYELADVDDYDDLKTEDMTDAQKSEAGEEFGAKLAEESLKPEAQRAPWYERALFKLRELLRKLFPKLRISRRDLETLLREAAHRLRRGRVRQSETGAGEGVRLAVEKKPASVKEFLEMPGHTRPPRLNLTKQTPTAELFRVFKEHILDADITTPEGYRLVANEGHFYSFCCGKKDGVSKGFIARAKDAQEALRMVKESSISSSEMSGFEIDRLRNIKTYVDVMTDPDFSFREGDKITYGKKYDDIEDANGYTSVVLNLKGNELRPVHSGIERLTKDRLEGQNIKWYVKRTTGDSSEIPGSPTGETSEEQSGGYPNIQPSGEKSSGNGGNGGNGDAERLADDMDAALKQKFGSGNTSLRQVAAGFRKIEFQPGTVNLDLGGGKYDEATNYLAEKGVTNLVFDPVNRDADSNRRIFEEVKNGGVDTVTCNNVLNVIAEPAARDNVILQAAKALKPGGTAYFTVYEGDGSGAGRQSQADAWQENRKTADYLEEVKKHFGDVTLKNKVIIARQPLTEGKSSAWFMDASFENPLRFAIEDGDDAPLVEPKPFDPDRDVDYEDPDERAIAVLIPRYGTAAEFDDNEVADYLHGAGFYDVTPQQAHKLVARARETYRKQRTAEIRHNNARRRDDWLYDNVPLYRHAVDFGGKGFKIRMPKDYAHKDDSGTLLAKPSEPGIDLIELAKYIGRVEGRPNEEKEIAEELADFYRECEAVEKFGLVDEHGNKLDVGYDEYMRKKADMRAYLAATQYPPSGDPQMEHTGDNDNIPPVGEKSSGGIRKSIEDGDDSPLVEPKPFDPERDVARSSFVSSSHRLARAKKRRFSRNPLQNGKTRVILTPTGSVKVFRYGKPTKERRIMATIIIDPGVTSKNLVLNDDMLNVYGEARYTDVNSGGLIQVYSGGQANFNTVNSSGNVVVYSGGKASYTYLNGGANMVLFSGGVADDTTVSSGGVFGIGGTANSTTVYEGAIVQVLNNGVARSTTVTKDAELEVLKGGSVNKTTVNGGDLYLSSGAVAHDTKIYWGGSMTVNRAAANSTTVSSGYLKATGSGAQLHSTTVSSGGSLFVAGSAIADYTTVNDALMYVTNNGIARSTTINHGAMTVSGEYSLALWTTVNSDSFLNVYNGGTTDSTWVYGGNVIALSGAWIHNTIVASGGTMALFGGSASGTWAFSRACFRVLNGGSANNTIIAADTEMELSNGGHATSTTVNSGGLLAVSGGCFATSTTINSGGTAHVFSGAEVISNTVNPGGSMLIAGKAEQTDVKGGTFGTLFTEGELRSTTVYAGTAGLVGGSAFDTTVCGNGSFSVNIGIANDTTVSGGYMELSAFNTGLCIANNTIVSSGGVVVVSSGGVVNNTTLYGEASLQVMEYGRANNTEVATWGQVDIYGGSAWATNVYDGGGLQVNWGEVDYTTVNSGGWVVIGYNGVARDTTVNTGATLRVESGGEITGTLTIGSDSKVLFERGGILDFDVSVTRAGAPALVNDLSLVQGVPDFTITVSDYQVEGSYSLADGATDFAERITVSTDSGMEIGTLMVGSQLFYGDYTYGLDLTDSLLSLTVTQGVIPPTEYKPGDIDANGCADIVMTITQAGHGAEGATGAWLIQGNQTAVWGDLSQRNPGWEIFGLGRTDMFKATNDVYLKSADNVVGAWVTGDDGKVTGWETVGQFDENTQVLGLGDFNGNGQTDLLLRNVNGAVGCYLTAGDPTMPAPVTGWQYFQSLGDEWTIAAVGDVNGDGRSDVVLKHDAGFAGCWITQSDYTVAWTDLDTLQDGFSIVGCGDFNGDGGDDVLLQKGTYFGAWYLQAGRPGVGWMGLGDFGDVTVEQIADFNGDNIDDLRLRTAAGDLGAHLVRGEDSTMWAYYGSVGSEWSTSLASI